MSWLLKRVVTHKKSSKLKLTSNKSYYHNFDKDIQNYYNEQLDAQKRTFTKWCNAQLSKVEVPYPLDTPNNSYSINYTGTLNQPYSYLIVDLGQDLQDGIRLLKLLEVLSGKETPKPERTGRVMMRIHKILNVGKALTFLQSQLQEPLQNIGSEDIVDGNLKLTMALIWILILKYKISLAFEQEFEDENENKIEDITEKEELITEKNKEDEELFNNVPTNMELNDFTRNSTILKRSNGVKRLSNISNKGHSDFPVEMTDEQQKAKNSWKMEDTIPELPALSNKNSWRRSTIRHSKTLNRRMSSINNGHYGIKTDVNKNDSTSPLRKSASVASPLSSQNPKILLLNWCKNILKLYVELEITNPINDFSKSWQNGVAFLSLIHSIRNDIVPEIDILVQEKMENGNKFENILPTPKRTASLSNPSSASTFKLYTAEPKDWYNNLERAFQLAEKYFKIISLLDPNDIISVKNPDERIIMTYISEFYWYIQREKKLSKEEKLNSPISTDISETENNIELKEPIPKTRKRANTSTSMTLNNNINNSDEHKLRNSKSQGQLILNKKHSNISFKSINSIFTKSSSNKNSQESNKSNKSSISFDYFKSNNENSSVNSFQNQYNNLNNNDNNNYYKNYENNDNNLSNDNYNTHLNDNKYKHISYLNNKDDLQQRLDNEIKNYLNIADKFSLWIKETQQVQYQILWFLFSMTNANETLERLSPPKSTISPIYTPIFDPNSTVEDLDSIVEACVNKLEYELINLDEGNSDGAIIKQQFNKAFEQITKTASIIDREMKELNINENQTMITKRNDISSIATIYSTHSSILQHLEQLIKYTFPQTKKILQNYVRWNKEWDDVLTCVNEDLIVANNSEEGNISGIADISMTESIFTTRSGVIALPDNNNNANHSNLNSKSLKQEVEDWIQKIDEINEKVSELMLKREQAMKVRRNTLQAYSNKFNLHKQNITKNRWTLLYNITKDQVKKSIFKNIYDVDIEKLNKNNKIVEDGGSSFDRTDSDDVFNSSKIFSQLENELASYSKSLNSEYPAKLNNLYQRIESLISFLEAEFKNRTQLNTRRIFPSLPLGGVTRLTKLPTLTSIPPPNLQFSYFPQFMIKNADEVIDHGKNEVLQPLINDGIDRVSNLGTIVRDLLQNISNRRKESDKLQDILLKEEQREAENLRYIQNKIMDYYRMIKRLEIWIDNTKQDLSIFKEQIPDINLRLKDKSLSIDVEYIETDRTALDNTKTWCINITNTIEDMMKENYLEVPKKNSQNLSRSNFNRLWREINNDIISYEGSEIEDSTDESNSSVSIIDESMENYIPKHAIHEILFNNLKEFNLSIHKFINNTIAPTQETLNNLINKKINLLQESWTKESANIKEFLENSKKNQFNNESFEVIEDRIKNQLRSIFENWNDKVKNISESPTISPRIDKEKFELFKYNIKEIKNIQEIFNQQLTSIFQNLSQIISMRTENEVPTFNQQLIDFENDQWSRYIDLSINLKKYISIMPHQEVTINVKTIDDNINQLTILKDEVMEMNTFFIQKETVETPLVIKRLIAYNNKANSILDVSKNYNDKMNIISQLVDTLTSENNINNELEKIYTSIYAAIKKMISDNSELELSEIENISLMRPAIFNIQQQLKEVIYANIMQLDDNTINKRNSMKRVSQIYNISSIANLDIVDLENNDVCKEINDFSKEYIQYNQGIINYYNTVCYNQYLNIQQLLTETTEWYNIYHQLFEWISAADRLRVDNEERIKKYSTGGTYEVPYGYEPKLDKKRIEEIEQEQSRLENRHKEFKNGSRYRRVINSKKNILDSMNKISTSENVLSKNKRLLNAVMNINERHTSLMFTKENRKVYETENYTLLPEIIKKFVEYRLQKFTRVERKLMEIIQIRSTDIIICKKIFNDVNLPSKALFKDISSMNDDLDNVLIIQKQNLENMDNYESIMKGINTKASTIVNHTLELIQNIKNIIENSVAKEYELLSKELNVLSESYDHVNPDTSYDGTNLTEYQENKIKKIKKTLSSIISSIMEKNKLLNEHYENVLEELTKNLVRNWEEKSNIITTEHWIINLKGNLNKYIEVYENVPSNTLEHIPIEYIRSYIQEAIQSFEIYQEEIKTREPLIESAKQNTDKLVKTLRSLISSSSNSMISQVSSSLYESIQNSPTPKMASPFESILSSNNEIIKKRSMDTLSLSISTMKRPNTALYNKPEEIVNRFKNIKTFFTKISDVIYQELYFAYQSKEILDQYSSADALLSSLRRRIQKFIDLTSENGAFIEKDKANDSIITKFEEELHEVEKININKNLSEIIDNLIGSQSEKSTIMEETIIFTINESVDILKEHAKNLQEQIVSLKRTKILFEGYIKQSHEVRNWIIENHDILEKFNKSIDEQTIRCEEVKQKFIAENIEDIPEEEIRIAYQTEEAIINDIIENLNNEEIAIKRYEITYEHLKTYSNKILSDSKISKGILSDNSLKIINEYQDKVSYLWNSLNNKLEVLKNRLEIRIKVLLWIKKMEESETVMWSLEESIEKSEELNVEVDLEDNPAIQFGKAVDDVMRDWEYKVSFREETHEKLKNELNDIEARAESIDCVAELEVFNKNWYLINISESLASLQELFEYKKQRLFETSQQLEQWIIQLNSLEEWITITNSTLKENLDSNEFAVIGDNNATNQTNIKAWSHNQISLSLQISNEISNKLKTLNTIKEELLHSFIEVVPPITRESYIDWISDCHEKLNTLYEEIEDMKVITDKLLERATQYQQWQEKLYSITSDVDDISEMINYEEVDDNMYIALYDRLNNLEKNLKKIINDQSIPVDISSNDIELINAKNLKNRTDELQKRIDENRKIIQDSQENVMKIKIVNTINQELERIDLWCTSTMRDLPKASLLMETMNTSQNSSIKNIETLPIINIEILSKNNEDDIIIDDSSVEDLTNTETALKDAYKLHNFVNTELQQNKKDMNNLRQTYDDTFKNIPSLDNQYQIIEKRLDSVNETLISGLNRLDVIKKIYSHDKATFEIFAWIDTANKKLQVMMSDSIESSKANAIHELENRIEIFHSSIKDYSVMTEKIQSIIKHSSINAKEKNNYSRVVNERSNAIYSEWDIINELLTSIKNDKSQKEREMKYNIILNEINQLITGIKERIFNVGKLNNINNNKNEDQLNIIFGRLEGELIAGVYPKLSLFEQELENLDDHESNEYIVFHKKLCNLHTQADILIEIINERKIKLRILKYVQNHNKITDKIEQQISEFNKVIDNQSNNMSKSDIETALAVLDSKAMYFNASIFKMIEESKEQIENIKESEEELNKDINISNKNDVNSSINNNDKVNMTFIPKDDWKVLERQHQIEKKWENIKAKVKRRKDLLSAKLISKSEGQSNSGIPRSNRARTNSNSSNSSYRLSVLRSGSTTPSNSRTPSRNRARSTTPANNNVKKRNRKPSLYSSSTTPVISPTPPPAPTNLPSGPIRVFIPVNDYIPNPKDKLDVEVARIVNKCPKSIKVTKADGEGKYWFGEVIPKLCYCRYLRSGLIMVRVGGGWQELGKFLLEHSNLEHRIPLVRSFAPEDASIAEENSEGQVIELDRNEAANTSYTVLQKLAASKTNKLN